MNDWKRLQIDDLPADILTGGYDFLRDKKTVGYVPYECSRHGIITQLCDGEKFLYRRKQKPAPTHEEIMTKWWKRPDGVSWFRVTAYSPLAQDYYSPNQDGYGGWHKRYEFAGFESADMPPEE